MKTISKMLTMCIVVFLAAGSVVWAGPPRAGQAAKIFKLKDDRGYNYDLAAMKDNTMMVLYFFDAASRPSQEGLLHLDQLAKEYADADMVVWGITASSSKQVAAFVKQVQPRFPILMDTAKVSDDYQARTILPTVCILGPELKVLDYFQGGGKATEVMLVRLAQRQLQRKDIQMAKAISDKVVQQNPKNVQAKALKGYAALKQGDLADAEKTFSNLAADAGEAEVVGKEGLAMVYAKKGDSTKAMALVAEVESKAPDRAYTQVVKGDILYSRDQKQAAGQAYEKAVADANAEPFQKALANNQLGRLKAAQGDFTTARKLYDQAVEIDPFYVEATSNIGVTYEREGKWDEALSTFRRASVMDKDDAFAAILAEKAEQMLALQKDTARNQRVDQLVKELAERYRSGDLKSQKREDDWTSRPMVLTFVDFQEKGALPERDGLSSVMIARLGSLLNQSGRLQVVERVVMERLLEELNIGSSQLADPETALKLGKILAAKLIGTGELFISGTGPLLNMRLIDTETSAIAQVFSQPLNQGMLERELFALNRQILQAVIKKYPLQGYVVMQQGEQWMLNLGAAQGVVSGTRFSVVEDQPPVKYKGRMLHGSAKVVGELEVVTVEPDLCYVRVVNMTQDLKPDAKVVEKNG